MAPQDQAYCEKARALETVSTRADPATDPALALAAFQAAVAELVPVAPAELQTDVAKVDAAVRKITSYDELRRLGSADLQQATDNIDDWTKLHCGFQIGRS